MWTLCPQVLYVKYLITDTTKWRLPLTLITDINKWQLPPTLMSTQLIQPLCNTHHQTVARYPYPAAPAHLER